MRNSHAQAADMPHAVPIPTAAELAERVDWRDWYLTDEEDMGESVEQTAIIAHLMGALRTWFAERGWDDAFAGGDNFFAWVESQPEVRISPDIYVLLDPPVPHPASWQTWRDDHPVPPFAMEIVSSDWKKDYESAPAKYAQLGVEELVIFDPGALEARSPERVVFQLWCRRDGMFVCEAADAGPIRSECLGLWLVAVDGRPEHRLRCRLSRDRLGRDLVLDGHERSVAEAQRAEQEARRAEQEARRAEREARRAEQEARRAEQEGQRAEQEARRAEKEAERANAAEARIAELEATLRERND